MGHIHVCDVSAAPCDDPEDQMVVADTTRMKEARDKSRGIVTLIGDPLAKIKPTEPFMLAM